MPICKLTFTNVHMESFLRRLDDSFIGRRGVSSIIADVLLGNSPVECQMQVAELDGNTNIMFVAGDSFLSIQAKQIEQNIQVTILEWVGEGAKILFSFTQYAEDIYRVDISPLAEALKKRETDESSR